MQFDLFQNGSSVGDIHRSNFVGIFSFHFQSAGATLANKTLCLLNEELIHRHTADHFPDALFSIEKLISPHKLSLSSIWTISK
jgi:hypothetical protein